MAFDLSTAKPVSKGFDLSTAKPVAPPDPSAWDYAKTTGNAFVKGAAGLADSFNNLPENLANLVKMAVGTPATYLGRPDLAPDVKQPTNAFANAAQTVGLTSSSREPVDTTGRILDFAGKVIGSGGRNPYGYVKNIAENAPISLLKNATVDSGLGLLGGAGQEVGQRAFGEPGGYVGGLLGMGGPAYLSTRMGTTASNLNRSLRGVSQADLDAAQALQQRSVTSGSPITGAEAINQTAGSIPSLQTLQRVTEQSSGGSPIMAPFMNARPANNAGLYDRTMAPLGGVVDPRMIAANAQDAAKGVINDQRQAGNTAARPFYDASVNGNARIPANDWENLTSNPIIQSTLESVRKDPMTGLSTVLEPPGSMRWLDATKKKLDDIATSAYAAGENNKGNNASQAAKQINAALDLASPQYAIGRYITGGNMQHNVAPLENGPIGKIAQAAGDKTGALTTQYEALVNGDNTTPDLIRKTVGQLNLKNPDAARELAIQGLKNEFDTATGRLVSGENQWGGAKFAKSVDTPKVQAYLESLPNGKEAYRGFRNMLDIFEAQGTRAAPGSLTASNMQGQKELTGAGLGAAVMPNTWLPKVSQWYNDFRLGGNSKELAQILTDPQSVAKMRKLAMLNPSSPSAGYAVSQLINRDDPSWLVGKPSQ